MYIHVIRFCDYTSDLDRVNSAPPGSSRKSFILAVFFFRLSIGSSPISILWDPTWRMRGRF